MEDGRLGDADTNGAATDQPSPEWYATPCVMGIDEAGRGPVLDSKTLTEAKREVLFESIKADQSIAWDVDVIPASLLSAQMLSRQKRSLNAISHESAIGLIQRALNKGCILAEVFLDTVGDAEKYALRLREKFPGIEITVSKKADSLFPIVSAASIVAKVTRDHTLRDWKSDSCLETGSNFGSGYPAGDAPRQ
ncbi:hypothetical protein CBR_g29781 [Chara braunii]|uniref:Ribonuclease n=1 Tax=Chara braunii TaxID=69332 RepID=A0A388LBF0_CHABU|nr:hypothetical protein CBR_g29781 [Chara braunii]|eukprot:GBG79631.1 hypothetical protein CBR_g29781 [Chara braunii]